jgi:RNA binding exosome subunit
MKHLQLSNLSYEDLENTIKAYQSLDFKTASIEDADKLLRLIIKHFVTQTLVWNSPVIFRARKHIDEVLFKNTDELIYPKNPTTLGRLNNIGESLFYGASHHDTALLEMRPKLGDEITILESRLINLKNAPKFMEVGLRELMTSQNNHHEFIKQNKTMLKNTLATEDNQKRYSAINNFLVNEITKIIKNDESHKYKGTIAIGQFYIKGNNLADGMLYPSINRTGAECIAIKPESYHRFYRPDRCFKIKIVGMNSVGMPGAHCVDNSTKIDFDGNITWT